MHACMHACVSVVVWPGSQAQTAQHNSSMNNPPLASHILPCHTSPHSQPKQLPGMEAWMKAQEAAIGLSEAAHLPRPSSVPLDAYSRPSLFLSSASPAPASPLQQHQLQARASSLSLSPQPFSVTTAVAGEPNATYSSPAASPFRGSFLAGANQDLLAAGALASCGILTSSSGTNSSRYTLLSAKVGMAPAFASSLPTSLPDGMHQVSAAATIPAAPAATLSRVPVPMVSQLTLACWAVLDLRGSCSRLTPPAASPCHWRFHPSARAVHTATGAACAMLTRSAGPSFARAALLLLTRPLMATSGPTACWQQTLRCRR